LRRLHHKARERVAADGRTGAVGEDVDIARAGMRCEQIEEFSQMRRGAEGVLDVA
jgi:hypothetical protein